MTYRPSLFFFYVFPSGSCGKSHPDWASISKRSPIKHGRFHSFVLLIYIFFSIFEQITFCSRNVARCEWLQSYDITSLYFDLFIEFFSGGYRRRPSALRRADGRDLSTEVTRRVVFSLLILFSFFLTLLLLLLLLLLLFYFIFLLLSLKKKKNTRWLLLWGLSACNNKGR